MQTRREGFAAWSYEHEKIECDPQTVDLSEPGDRGPIIFEHVSAVASTIKDIFEREMPRPLSRLPYELRCQIYTWIENSERSDTVRFTVR